MLRQGGCSGRGATNTLTACGPLRLFMPLKLSFKSSCPPVVVWTQVQPPPFADLRDKANVPSHPARFSLLALSGEQPDPRFSPFY